MPDVVDDIDVWFFASRWRRHAEPLVYKINKLTAFDRASCEAIRGDMATPFLHKALQGPNVVKTPRDVVSSDVFESRHIVEECIACVKNMTATSKAFRARLDLAEHDAMKLQLWAKRNCAISGTFVGPRRAIILVALKDRPRSAASFARTIRSALTAMAIPTSCLNGHWVTLITEEEALKLCHTNTADLHAANHGGQPRPRSKSSTATDSDSKTVFLPG